MNNCYVGAGFTEYAEIEIREFVAGLSNSMLDNSCTLETNQIGLNRQLSGEVESLYPFSREDLLLGHEHVLYWQDESGQDYGGISISMPWHEDSEDEAVEELLPFISGIYTQHLFDALDIENPGEYELTDYLTTDYSKVVMKDEGESEIYTAELETVVVEHNELPATLYWHGIAANDFVNFYGCIYQESNDKVLEHSSTALSACTPGRRFVDTGFEINPIIVGGFNWNGLPSQPLTRFKTPMFDSKLFYDTPENNHLDMVIGEEVLFPVPNGRAIVRVGHSNYHTCLPPDSGTQIEASVSNDWDDVFYYEQDGQGMETITGRIDFSSDVFMWFRVDVEEGFIGTDNYYKLERFLANVSSTHVDFEDVFANLFLNE